MRERIVGGIPAVTRRGDKVRLRSCGWCTTAVERISPKYGDIETNPQTGMYWFSLWAHRSLRRREPTLRGRPESFCAACARLLTEKHIEHWKKRRKTDDYIYYGGGDDRAECETAAEKPPA